MSKHAIIEELENKRLKKDVPEFHVGDTIAVQTRIIEGSKERLQTFTGTVIARKGHGLSETFSLHRVAYGEGMERVFLLHSPRIASIEVIREGDVRRAKLYYLRGTTGKKAKVKGRVISRSKSRESNGQKAATVPVEASEIAEEPVEEVVSSPEAELAAEAVASHNPEQGQEAPLAVEDNPAEEKE